MSGRTVYYAWPACTMHGEELIQAWPTLGLAVHLADGLMQRRDGAGFLLEVVTQCGTIKGRLIDETDIAKAVLCLETDGGFSAIPAHRIVAINVIEV